MWKKRISANFLVIFFTEFSDLIFNSFHKILAKLTKIFVKSSENVIKTTISVYYSQIFKPL